MNLRHQLQQTRQNLNKKPLANFPHLKGLHLAHPVTSTEQFNITLLIGADHYWDVVEDHIVRSNGPTAMRSKLGYLLSGPLGAATPANMTANILHVATQPTQDPDLQRFWSVESLGISPGDDSNNTFLENYISKKLSVYLMDLIVLASHGRITTLLSSQTSQPVLVEPEHWLASWLKLLIYLQSTMRS